MSSVSERTRNNVKAGIFVTIALALALGTLYLLTDLSRSFEKRTTYSMRYGVNAGVQGLGVGSDVRVGGLSLGFVSDIRPEQSGDTLETILVDFELDSAVTLYPNAAAVRVEPLLGNVSWINFLSVGDASAGPALPEGTILDAAPNLGMLTTLLGEKAGDIDTIVDDVAAGAAFFATLDREYESRFVPMLDDAGSMLENADETFQQVRADYQGWREQVTATLTSVNDAADRLDEWVEAGNTLLADADALMANANAGVDDVRAAIDANRPDVDAFVDNMTAFSDDAVTISDRVERELLTQLAQLLDRGYDGVDAFSESMASVNEALDENIPQVNETLASARLASQQLKLALIEIRRSPWKVLYQPSQSELEHELLYEAARSFALAASDLKASSASIERLMERHGNELTGDSERLAELRARMVDSFENYEKAQQRLFDVLLTTP